MCAEDEVEDVAPTEQEVLGARVAERAEAAVPEESATSIGPPLSIGYCERRAADRRVLGMGRTVVSALHDCRRWERSFASIPLALTLSFRGRFAHGA